MTPKPKVISDTARALLTAAATRGDSPVRPPKLPIAAARQVVRSLLIGGLVEEVPAPIDNAGFAWRTGEDGGSLMLRATAVGIRMRPLQSRARRRSRRKGRVARQEACWPT